MATPELFGDQEIQFLAALLDEGVDFILVGLGAATLQGAPVVTQDVDLWFDDIGDPGIQRALRQVGGAYVPPTSSRPPMFAGGGAALFDIVVNMHGMRSFTEERADAVMAEIGDIQIPVLPLRRIIASKEATDRPKDRLALPVLRDALRTLDAQE